MNNYQTIWRLALSLSCLLACISVGAQTSEKTSSLDHAKELWELALQAKGGRERINGIESIAFIRDYRPTVSVRMTAFPDKSFYWWGELDAKGTGVACEIKNYASGFGFNQVGIFPRKTYQDIRTDPAFQSTGSGELFKGEILRDNQLRFLLETRWQRPELLSAGKATIGGRSYDRVDVRIPGDTAASHAIFLDEKTHLPMRFQTCRDTKGTLTGSNWGTEFRSYKVIDGISLPTQISEIGSGRWDKIQIELNPEYEPKVFEREPDLRAGPFQWRKAGTIPPATQAVSSEQIESLTTAQISQYIRDLASPDDEVSKYARRELVTAGRQVIPALTEALKAGSPAHRFRSAVVILGIDNQNPAAMAALPEFLLDPQLGKADRQDAAFGLLRNERGIAVLIELLSHHDPFVRRCVVFAFDSLTERAEIPQQIETALPALRKLTRDKDEVIRGMAKEVLEQIGNRFKR